MSNPQFTLGGNRYALNMEIPSGSYVTVTSIAGLRTIVMTAENGDKTNVFDKGRRGTGSTAANTYSSQFRPATAPWSGMASVLI